MAFDFISSALEQRRRDGLLRKRQIIDAATGPLIEIGKQHYLNFSSNDYLAMRRSSVVMQAWADGISEFGGGSGASPLVTGYTNAHQALEDHLAEMLNREKVLLFNSGFAANQAVCQALFDAEHGQKQDRILADKLMHASFIEGAMGSQAKLQRFKHNDLEHLQTLLDLNVNLFQNTLIATEGVFSMDGDQAPLADMVNISQQAKAWLMVDDAHGFGCMGEKGAGVIESAKLSQQQVPIIMATFGKAIGTAGAFVAGSHEFIDYLVNFAKHYIYSTAMPAAQAYATLCSLRSKRISEQRNILKQRIAEFRALAKQADLSLLPSTSAIQPILIGDPEKALKASQRLKALGLWVTPIRYPTVPKNTDRLRITLTTGHESRDIQALVDGLQLVLNDKSSVQPNA